MFNVSFEYFFIYRSVGQFSQSMSPKLFTNSSGHRSIGERCELVCFLLDQLWSLIPVESWSEILTHFKEQLKVHQRIKHIDHNSNRQNGDLYNPLA